MRLSMTSSALCALLIASATPVLAQGAQAERRFDIRAGSLERALPEFARQSGEQILYPAALVAGRRTAGVSGPHRADAALAVLLRDTGLSFRRTAPGALVVFDPAARAETDGRDEPTELEEVVVTGSLIRGAEGPSPVVVVTREQMDRDGRATVAQALAALPQNFGGTANEGALGNGGDRSGTNATFANGVNLRGLGSDATLVLINGRRIAGSGAKGDFADVSTIPTAAVERIDVLLDGASALYGADAVGGVVNVVLRRDYDGAETRLRVGDTGDGASGEYQFGQTFGRRWSGGGGILTYEYYDREALAASERRLAGDADLRWRGGSDRRQYYSSPGNIVAFDPALGAYRPTYAIPPGQDGSALAPGDFLAGQINLENHRAGANVLPRQTRQSLFGALRQEFDDRLEISADLRYGRRDYDTVSFPISTLLTVTQANPYFVSPTGAASHTIAYSFQEELASPRISGRAENAAATLGGRFDLNDAWRIDAYVAYASDRSRSGVDGAPQSTYLREALGAIADNPATPFSAARDGYLNPFGDGPVNAAAVLDFISSGYTRTHSETSVASANFQLDGTLLELPGGPLRLAAGMSFRRETFERQFTGFTSGLAPNVGAPAEAERDVAAAFGELRLPLYGQANARPGLRRLELSLAARFEDYGDTGQTTSPKFGVIWAPWDAVLLKANYGRSFRAPALRELNDAASASPSLLPRDAQQILSMILYGGNPDLEPETADSWSFGAELRPTFAPGLKLGANAFRVDFDNRIGQPALENILSALGDPALSPFVRTLDPVNNAEDRAAIQAILDLPTTALRDAFPATAYGAIVDARYVNTARVQVQGVDLSAAYAFAVGPHAFDLRADWTWLERFDAQPTRTSAAVSQLDRPNYPVSLRGRTTVAWSRGDWGASASLNHAGGYEDLDGDPIDAWTTADLQVRFAPTAGPLDGATVSLTVQNVFDQDPPFYDAPEGVGYDAANANVLGRFVSLQLTKSW